MRDRELVVVESIGAADHYLKTADNPDAVTFLTTSPSVLEHFQGHETNVSFMDADLTQAQGNQIGYASLYAGTAIAQSLDQTFADLTDYSIGNALKVDIHRLVGCLLYKMFILDGWVRRGGDRLVVVGKPELAPVAALSTSIQRFDTVFATLAALLDLRVKSYEAEIPKGAQSNGVFLKVNAWTRLNTLLDMPRRDPLAVGSGSNWPNRGTRPHLAFFPRMN